ncbi:MAG: nuclear transport factor 2 family protein [Chthoniobacterales bacterium]|nr:nuclear transport factor 2 family protein [Chthoniobacterales bacterium]
MNTEEVAKKLVELCEKGAYKEATSSLYGENIVSVEAHSMGGMPAEINGFDAVCKKTQWWIENHEVHSSKVTGPFVARDTFVVRFDIDVTEKNSGKRMQASEIGIYKVKEGKVVREEFLPMV